LPFRPIESARVSLVTPRHVPPRGSRPPMTQMTPMTRTRS
jgi:hypothetical protein